jgi:choice-of-anchor C domain-containing protein
MKALQASIAVSVLVLLMAVAGRPAAAQTNLLLNGSFESPAITGQFITIPAGGSLTDWVVGGGGIDLIRDHWVSADGAQSIDLSALTTGSISQGVSTTIGATYNLIFEMAGNPNGGDTIKDMNVDVTGYASSLEQFNITGFSQSNMGWSQRTISFVALSNTTTISFTSLDNNAFGPALDNVRLFEDTAAGIVPEPGTFALLGSGLGMVALLRRRRRSS